MRRLIKKESGQAMVEMALVLPILLLLVFGIIEFGNAYFTKIEMNNLARQAVRTAVVSDDYGKVKGDVEDIAKSRGMEATVSIKKSGSDVIATVSYDIPKITGIIIGTKPIAAVSEATMRAE